MATEYGLMTGDRTTISRQDADPPLAAGSPAYFEKEATEGVRGEAYDLWRFRRTAKALPTSFDTLLDVGCGEGCWLHYVSAARRTCRAAGVEISPTRVEEARNVCPAMDIRVGGFPVLPFADASSEVVTCLEVLEHLPDWRQPLEELLRVARKRVIITVPYRQKIKQYLCIHCQKVTPADGHLHTFSEESFSFLSARYRVSFRRIRTPEDRFVARLYFALFPRYRWLAVIIDVKA